MMAGKKKKKERKKKETHPLYHIPYIYTSITYIHTHIYIHTYIYTHI